MEPESLELKTFIIAGPGTRKKVVVGAYVSIGHSGDLQVWSSTNMIVAFAHGEWATFWIEEPEIVSALSIMHNQRVE